MTRTPAALIAGAATVVRVVGFGVQSAAGANEYLNVLQYLAPLAAAAWGLSQVFHQKVTRFIPLSPLPDHRALGRPVA